jgi:hypothetical protein
MPNKISKKQLIAILKGQIKKENGSNHYQDLADCIRSDQVPANHVAEYFNNKSFYNWYKKRYKNT